MSSLLKKCPHFASGMNILVVNILQVREHNHTHGQTQTQTPEGGNKDQMSLCTYELGNRTRTKKIFELNESHFR